MYTITCKSHFGDGFKINRQTFLDMMHNNRENFRNLKSFEKERITIVIDRLMILEGTILCLKNHYNLLDKNIAFTHRQTISNNLSNFNALENKNFLNKESKRKFSLTSISSEKTDKINCITEKIKPLIIENSGESPKGNFSFHFLMNSSVKNSTTSKNISIYSVNKYLNTTNSKNSKKLSIEKFETLPNIKSINKDEKKLSLNTSTNFKSIQKNHNNSNSYDFKSSYFKFSSKELPCQTESNSKISVVLKESFHNFNNRIEKMNNHPTIFIDSNLLTLKKIVGSRTYFNSTFENTQKAINNIISGKGLQSIKKL